MKTIDWQLRYRSPNAPTKGVDDVTIQINERLGEPENETLKRARAVADFWLGREMGHPSTKFIYLRRVVVMSEDRMQLELRGGNPFSDADLQEMSGGQAQGQTQSERPQSSTPTPASQLTKAVQETGDVPMEQAPASTSGRKGGAARIGQ